MLDRRSAGELASAVRRGESSSRKLIEATLDRIDAVDSRLNAFVRVDREVALERAAEIDRRRANGDQLGALAGVPIAVKDNIAVARCELTCGSRILSGYVSPFSATAVERVEAADGVIVGHTNMDEFGMGSSCESSAYGPTRNPWDLDRVPGGSSGGSAAAVAAGCVPLALGTDTGGSIRQPAALCGIVGVKPTYGSVSRYGLVAFASSLDQIGPLARSVDDAELLLSVIAGVDPRDATSVQAPSGSTAAPGARRRIGVPSQLAAADLEEVVAENWKATLALLGESGAELVEVDLPTLEAAVAVYYVLANSEASANLARFDGARYGRRASGTINLDEMYVASRSQGFGPEVKRRILLGTFALSSGYYDAYYGRAVAVAGALRRDLGRALESCDVIALPTSPTGAFALGERLRDPLSMYLSDVYTVPASLTGLPALAVPSGTDADGLPLSLQLIGPAFGEATLFECARAFEAAVGFERRLVPEAEDVPSPEGSAGEES